MTAAQFRKTVSGVGGYSSSAMTSKCTTHGCPGDIHKLHRGNVCVATHKLFQLMWSPLAPFLYTNKSKIFAFCETSMFCIVADRLDTNN